jgi:hypothetical protein
MHYIMTYHMPDVLMHKVPRQAIQEPKRTENSPMCDSDSFQNLNLYACSYMK